MSMHVKNKPPWDDMPRNNELPERVIRAMDDMIAAAELSPEFDGLKHILPDLIALRHGHPVRLKCEGAFKMYKEQYNAGYLPVEPITKG